MRIALDVRIKNAAIAEGMRLHECGLRDLAKLAGVSMNTLCSYSTLRKNPWRSNLRERALKPSAQKIAKFLGLSDVDAFPPEVYAHFEKSPRRALIMRDFRELPLSAARHVLAESNPVDEVTRDELGRVTRALLETITPRQRRVIEMRMGFDGEGEKTLDEVAEHFQVGRERIRQIEARALRELRHPSRSRKLKAFLS